MKTVNVVVLTGAGISAESGIQTFRDGDGLWEKHRIEDVATLQGYVQAPQRVQRFYNSRRKQLFDDTIQPNAAHFALVCLEEAVKGNFLLVTQNIDNLHEKAGSRNLLHMHGELLKIRCVCCGKVFDWETDVSANEHCPSCQRPASLRPHIVWFGEEPLFMDEIYSALLKADYFISIGTSGTVYPAAGFVEVANQSGAKTIQLNLAPSQGESQFQEKIYGQASIVVPQFVEQFLHQIKEN